MHVEFCSVEVAGFKTFIDPAKLALTYANPGLTFVRGRNEVEPALGANDAGKSTLFDALGWCLWGRTVKGLRGPDIKPWSGQESPTVKVRLRVNDKLHSVVRSQDPNRLLLDRETVGQEAIDRLLGMDSEIFSQTVLLGQGRPLFFDLSPKDKMDLFSNTLVLDRWEDRAVKAGTAVVGLTEEQRSTENAIAIAQGEMDRLDRLIENAQVRYKEWQDEQRTRTEATTKQVSELKAQLETAQRNHDASNLAYDEAMTEIKSLEKEVSELDKLVDTALAKHHEEQANTRALASQRNQLEAELEAFGKADKCPICGQSIKGTNLAKHKNELKAKINALNKQLQRDAPAATTTTLETLRKKREQARKYVLNYKVKADGARHHLDLYGPMVTEARAKITLLSASLLDEKVNPHREQINEFKKNRRKAEAMEEKLKEQLDELNQKVARTKFWVKGFKDVRLAIIEEVLQELEMATNVMLPESGLNDWQVRYAIERETKSGTVARGLNLTVVSPYNDQPVRWEVWGGGVSQRLRLVGALALSDVLLSHAGVTTNLEILDEPTRHLSKEGVVDLCEFLAMRAQARDKDIFYVDHMAVESAHFSDVLTVVKDKRGSRIE